MESPTNLLSKIADNRHYAPLLWCIMLLLPIGVLIWGENGNDELSLNDRILSFDAKWKMQTALTTYMVTCHVAAFFQQLRTGIRPHAQRRHTTLSHTHLAAVSALRDIPVARPASSLRHRIACRLGRTDMAGIRLFIDTFCSGPRLYADIYMAVGNSLDIGCTYPGMVVLLHLCRIRPCPDFSYRIFFSPDRRRKYHRYKKHGISRRSDHHRHMLRCIGQLSHDTP